MSSLLARLDHLAHLLASRHALDRGQGELLTALVLGRSEANDDQLTGPLVAWSAAALADPSVTEAFLQEIDSPIAPRDDRDMAGVERLARAVLGHHPRCAGAHVVVARCHEHAGDLMAMAASLRRAVALAPNHPAAHADLADLDALRGDFRSARRHHELAGGIGAGWVAVAASIAEAGPIRAPRNALCPCGSGRKHKSCCARTGGWPLRHRSGLLHLKLLTWLERPAGRRRMLPLACAAAGVARLVDAPELVAAALADPVLPDLHLFEGGGVAMAVGQVGPLLPPDEAEVLQRWADARHEVWAVERCGAGPRPWTLHDVRGSASVEVIGVGRADHLPEGTLLWAAIVPGDLPGVGDAFTAGEVIAISPDEAGRVGDVLDEGADPLALAGVLVEPRLSAAIASREAAEAFGRAAAGRARWLFGDVDLPPADLGDPDFVDDLVTTTFMAGGGFSAAADIIRAAAHQLLAAEPPLVWETAQRLEAEGFARDVILVHLGVALHAARCDVDAGPHRDMTEALATRLRSLPNLARS